MVIYGVALLSLCMLIGVYIGDLLGAVKNRPGTFSVFCVFSAPFLRRCPGTTAASREARGG
jgi:hypothetical protein